MTTSQLPQDGVQCGHRVNFFGIVRYPVDFEVGVGMAGEMPEVDSAVLKLVEGYLGADLGAVECVDGGGGGRGAEQSAECGVCGEER